MDADGLENTLRSLTGCFEPACRLSMILSAGSIRIDATLTIPDDVGLYGSNTSPTALAVSASASALVAQRLSTLSANLGYQVVSAAPVTTEVGLFVPLEVAPPPPISPPSFPPPSVPSPVPPPAPPQMPMPMPPPEPEPPWAVIVVGFLIGGVVAGFLAMGGVNMLHARDLAVKKARVKAKTRESASAKATAAAVAAAAAAAAAAAVEQAAAARIAAAEKAAADAKVAAEEAISAKIVQGIAIDKKARRKFDSRSVPPRRHQRHIGSPMGRADGSPAGRRGGRQRTPEEEDRRWIARMEEREAMQLGAATAPRLRPDVRRSHGSPERTPPATVGCCRAQLSAASEGHELSALNAIQRSVETVGARRVFETIDSNASGRVSADELADALADRGVDIRRAMLEEMIRSINARHGAPRRKGLTYDVFCQAFATGTVHARVAAVELEADGRSPQWWAEGLTAYTRQHEMYKSYLLSCQEQGIMPAPEVTGMAREGMFELLTNARGTLSLAASVRSIEEQLGVAVGGRSPSSPPTSTPPPFSLAGAAEPPATVATVTPPVTETVSPAGPQSQPTNSAGTELDAIQIRVDTTDTQAVEEAVDVGRSEVTEVSASASTDEVRHADAGDQQHVPPPQPRPKPPVLSLPRPKPIGLRPPPPRACRHGRLSPSRTTPSQKFDSRSVPPRRGPRRYDGPTLANGDAALDA